MGLFQKVFAGLFLLAMCLPVSALAQDNFSGLNISPATHNLTAEPGTVVQGNVIVSNTTDEAITLDATVHDFTTVDEYHTHHYLPVTPTNGNLSIRPWTILALNELDPSFSDQTLKSRPELSGLTVPANGELTVYYHIKIPFETIGGGRYGSVRFTSSTIPNLQLGNEIYLRVTGQITDKGEVSDFKPESWFNIKQPVMVNSVFSNFGSSHLIPTGRVVISNMFNRSVSTLTYNGADHILLPNDRDHLSVRWNSGPIWSRFGLYKARLELTFPGTDAIPITTQTTFFLFPTVWLIMTPVIIFVIWLIIKYFRKHRTKKKK